MSFTVLTEMEQAAAYNLLFEVQVKVTRTWAVGPDDHTYGWLIRTYRLTSHKAMMTEIAETFDVGMEIRKYLAGLVHNGKPII
jgi:hypothetical protein